jgi:type VI secretion system protein ImpJ
MAWDNKTVWSEGMFLKAQHFQQFDHYVEKLVRGRVAGIRPFAWGVTELQINQPLLGTGKFAVSVCRGVLPDGTPFAVPEDADHPQPLVLAQNVHDCVVHLALPVRQPGGTEVEPHEQVETVARYAAQDFEATDGNAGSGGIARLRIGRLRLCLLPDTVDLAGYVTLGLGRVEEVRADRSILLDQTFIAPTLGCGASLVLTGYINELEGLLHRRAEALAVLVADPTTHGVAEIRQFLQLQIVNRYELLFGHFSAVPETHPETVFTAALEMAGELATLTSPTRRPPSLPAYRHDDLQACFKPLMDELRRSLSGVIEHNAVLLSLQERRRGIRVAVIKDHSLFTASFVLAVWANLPDEQVRRDFPRRLKIGPEERIDSLVDVALSGIKVQVLPVAPASSPSPREPAISSWTAAANTGANSPPPEPSQFMWLVMNSRN